MHPIVPGNTTLEPAVPPKAAAVSLCIVSNQLNVKLEEIIDAGHEVAAEILIGYDGQTAQIPAGFNVKKKALIIPLPWRGFSDTKNELAGKAKSGWILSLDGDEVPDEALKEAIRNLPFTGLPQNSIFSLKRISFFEGKKITHGAWGRDRVLRLYHKSHTRWDKAIVHENLEIKKDSEIIRLPGVLYHYTADNYKSFLDKNKNYARLSAAKYFARGKRSPLWKRVFSPLFTFIKEYIFLRGFMDGKAGLKIARVNALYTYWKYAFLKQKYQE